MEHCLYLLLDLGALIVPFLFSFHPRIRFDRQWHAFWPACLLVALAFIAWDVAFTRMGVWGFNARYLTGTSLLDLPIEEWLFFICIPYACIFTYHVFGTLRPDPWSPRSADRGAMLLAFISIIVGALAVDRWYTTTTFLALGLVVGLLLARRNTLFLGRFLSSYAAVLLPFFLINGILTGAFIEGEVVWYDNAENLGIRLGTIPLEDVFYGMLLILLNVVLFEHWRKPVQ